ncbi:hypothetical protein GPUN_2130 [Glaciecola punicea ACAM 611]|uniref:Uncharacterized protein n=1 Tax=Glaciecola punicea ACAM 611 TaxID=1121923 RepID=H5TD68_9ALTE|nr:hypothetical protein GPUN_2130 [Glaciecola punicea ACAM 611]
MITVNFLRVIRKPYYSAVVDNVVIKYANIMLISHTVQLHLYDFLSKAWAIIFNQSKQWSIF